MCLLIFNLLLLEGGKIDTTRFHPVHGLLSGPTLRTTINNKLGYLNGAIWRYLVSGLYCQRKANAARPPKYAAMYIFWAQSTGCPCESDLAKKEFKLFTFSDWKRRPPGSLNGTGPCEAEANERRKFRKRRTPGRVIEQSNRVRREGEINMNSSIK